MSQDPKKNHYVPVFYLQHWAHENGRLIEFARRKDGKVHPRFTHPSGTGYAKDIYTIPDAPPDIAHHLERRYFGNADTLASEVMRNMLSDNPKPLSGDHRVQWARFVISLLVRNPESVRALIARWKRELATIDGSSLSPENQERLRQIVAFQPDHLTVGSAMLFQKIADNEGLGKYIINMHWSRLLFDRSRFTLLTSDRPVVMSNGLAKKGGHLVLPISPTRAFLATNNEADADEIARRSPDELARAINDLVVRQAEKFVWGRDPSNIRFIKDRLAREPGKGKLLFKEPPNADALI